MSKLPEMMRMVAPAATRPSTEDLLEDADEVPEVEEAVG